MKRRPRLRRRRDVLRGLDGRVEPGGYSIPPAVDGDQDAPAAPYVDEAGRLEHDYLARKALALGVQPVDTDAALDKATAVWRES